LFNTPRNNLILLCVCHFSFKSWLYLST